MAIRIKKRSKCRPLAQLLALERRLKIKRRQLAIKEHILASKVGDTRDETGGASTLAAAHAENAAAEVTRHACEFLREAASTSGALQVADVLRSSARALNADATLEAGSIVLEDIIKVADGMGKGSDAFKKSGKRRS